jgi:hypothetical protein
MGENQVEQIHDASLPAEPKNARRLSLGLSLDLILVLFVVFLAALPAFLKASFGVSFLN